MAKKYISIDLDDSRIKDLADVISNKTSKKIINYLADREASETEMARDLKLPANTVNYNVKKLLKSGLIEKSKDFWWSVKGRKVVSYRVANQKIVISPKSRSKIVNGFLALVGTGGVGFLAEKYLMSYGGDVSNVAKEQVSGGMADSIEVAGDYAVSDGIRAVQAPEILTWVLVGALVFVVIYFLIGKIRQK
jgi:DNA-binding transcriptional ArsR family regulator